ncbi:hypothetical protein EJ02DRAFT_442585 [Clathrospora elynae]|uniref:FAD/NAD(P)-binding domain-containing protein n=1 Tax=Clathrospora elynae TaxID=706981 RepID=A0A6A5SVN1_9PLEO|nr:hypothetical protein EJ02DRAFT_442585 [Clathrospora elynae]
MQDQPLRHPRKLRVVTIGAAISAMNMAYEIHAELGGTRLVNTYPAVACDVSAHIYTFPFEPNPGWSAFYADVKTSYNIVHAEFDEMKGIWNLKLEHKGEVFDDWCNILVSATGFLSHWKWPEIPGLQDFEDLKTAKQVTNLIRNPTWITPSLGSAAIGDKVSKTYSEEEERVFREDSKKLNQYRGEIQHASNKAFAIVSKQSLSSFTTNHPMFDRLGGNEELATKLTPNWEVGCRRATPGLGYLEAFTQPTVSLVTDPISHISTTSIVTKDGTHHTFDVVVCATGFDVSHRPPCPIIDLDKTNLRDYWREESLAYIPLACPLMPSYFMFSGPNRPTGHGSLMAALSWMAQYIGQWVTKISTEDIKFVSHLPKATEEFNTYGDEVMERLGWSGGCRSWYKSNRVDGRVTAVWQGSALGFREVVERIRPEDFSLVYRSRNRLRWMGGRRTGIERRAGADLAFYLNK